jgi:hypothetical protein
MKKVVIIADIVDSKKIKNRAQVQEALHFVFKRINKNKNVISPYTITLGDEFQAVYNGTERIFKDILEIMLAVYPVKVRFSIGTGEITTRINMRQSLGMDGPAFYNARTGLNKLKNTVYLLDITTDKKEIDSLLGKTIHLISHHIQRWKKNRLEILVLLLQGLTPGKICKKVNLTDKAVYKNISAGALYVIISLFIEIQIQLNKLLKK